MIRSRPRKGSRGDRNSRCPRPIYHQGTFSHCRAHATPYILTSHRKRAKTEDEKEQRRIERVLRNRQAAQSSRERKRQEVEKLEGEKYDIEDQNQKLRESIMSVQHDKFKLEQLVHQLSAELERYKQGRGPTSDASSCATSPLVKPQFKTELADYPFNLPTPCTSVDHLSPATLSPPITNLSFSRSPSPSEENSFENLGSLDMTQHPAEMLCGLQCQSIAAWLRTIPNHRPRPRSPAPSSPSQLQSLVGPQLLFLMILSSAIYSSLPSLQSQAFSSKVTSPPQDKTSASQTLTMTSPSIRWSASAIQPPRRRTTLT